MGKAARYNRFAAWVKLKRVRSHIAGEQISQQRLADEIGVTVESISRIEQGLRLPSVEVVDKIAQFFQEDRDTVHLMTYHLTPDMYSFLVSTTEGERVVKNIRTIMNKVGKPTFKAFVPPSLVPNYTDRFERGKTFKREQDIEEQAILDRVAEGEDIDGQKRTSEVSGGDVPGVSGEGEGTLRTRSDDEPSAVEE